MVLDITKLKSNRKVDFVVPAEETVTEAARMQQRAKALGKFRTVLQRLELTFRERIVIRDMRPAETSGDAEIGEQQRHWLGSHRRTTVGMNRQLVQRDALLLTTLQQQLFGYDLYVVLDIFSRYEEHRHSGIAMLTPEMVQRPC